MSFLYATSATYRWIVRRSKSSPLFFAGFAAICLASAFAAAKGVQALTNPSDDSERGKKDRELLAARRTDALILASANKQRVQDMLQEIKEGRDINDRYQAALRGKTLVRPHAPSPAASAPSTFSSTNESSSDTTAP
ncbi:unnamed protein product [Closterium sp. NIES-64]|nr:unnamed protein product [Closterium sp. NIES-64]CAI6011074.1 unnamed protein product [Closterium sp. NIES-65]